MDLYNFKTLYKRSNKQPLATFVELAVRNSLSAESQQNSDS